MKRRLQSGFTLIELMVVVLIIGVFAAIAIPSIIENNKRNGLIDLTNNVEQGASEIRNIAVRTRRAAVLEIRENGEIWINRLNGNNCWSSIEKRCAFSWEQPKSDIADPSKLDLSQTTYANSNSVLCGISIAAANSGGTCDTESVGAKNAAFCYSGNGELWYRKTPDDAAKCDAASATLDRSAWTKLCIANNGTEVTDNGATLVLNRLENEIGTSSSCTTGSGILDVAREVHLPVGGSPYSKVQ